MSVGSSALNVERSGATGRAVFLSYASQDAEAAKRIAEALRAAGVEVWFDQSELRGGDAWDAMIRKRIKECALFVPIITPNTNARAEGYFRLEWKLAVDRSHLMADDAPFLFPIVLGDVTDATARVPDKFREVQWTRLRLDETPGELAARVARLLSGNVGRDFQIPPSSGKAGFGDPALQKSGRWHWWMIFPVLGTLMGLMFAAVPLWKAFQGPPPKRQIQVPDPKLHTLSEARQLAGKARVLIEAIDSTSDDFAAAEGLVKRALELDATDGEVWAVSSRINSSYLSRGFERSASRREAARSQAERAVKLAPNLPEAWLALGRGIGMSDAVRAEEALRRGLALAPADGRLLLGVASIYRQSNRFDEALALYEQAATQPETRALALYDQYLIHFYCRRFAEADRCLRESISVSKSANMVAGLALLNVTWRGDVAQAQRVLADTSAGLRGQTRVVLAEVLVNLMAGQPDEALQAFDRLPADYVNDAWYTGPKALLVGLAHFQAGRQEAARIAWEAGLSVVRRRLQEAPNDLELHLRLGELLAWTGQTEMALQEVRIFNELQRGRSTDWTYSAVRIHAALGRVDAALPLLEQLLAAPSSNRWPLTPALLRLDPLWHKIRGDPRFQKLCEEPVVQTAAPAAQVTDKSIAVLPFANMSEDKDATAFFADGVHEDVLTSLVGIRDLRVVSRTSVMDYRGTTKKIPEIGRELQVAYVLEGSVRRAGNKVRVTGQLIKAANDEHVWARSFDRDLTDIFAIQAELAKAIAGELDAALSPREQKLLAQRPTENTAAYDLFLKSREIVNRGAAANREELQNRERLLLSAVELDPKFVPAWCELVQAHVGLIAASVDTTPARLAKATAALDRARALAPDAPEVTRALGVYYAFGLQDSVRATEQFEKLVQLQPNDTESRQWLGTMQLLMGHWPETLATQRLLTQLDPGNFGFGAGFCMTLRAVRRYDEAMAEARRIKALWPNDTRLDYEFALTSFYATGSIQEIDERFARLVASTPDSPGLINGRKRQALSREDYQEYFRLDRLQPDMGNRGSFDSRVLGALEAAAVYRFLGDTEAARNRLGTLPATLRAQLELEPNNTQYLRSIAQVESILGHHEEALRWIERGAALVPDSKNTRIGMDMSIIRARILAWAGDKDRAIAELTRLLRLPSELNVHKMRAERFRWAPLVGDPRFEALLNDPKNNQPLF